MDKNVDYEIEQFWLGFKVSMNNFYKNYKNINRPIQQWSDYLNILQKKQDYENIEECIVKYISLYSIDLMRTHDEYHMHILNTISSGGIKYVINRKYLLKEVIIIMGVILSLLC